MWRPPQEKQLRVQPGDLEGSTGSQSGPTVSPALPKVHFADGDQRHQEDKATERKWRLGRPEGSSALFQHDPHRTVIHGRGNAQAFETDLQDADLLIE